ncbi:MAG: GAF domain-containing protein [Anaerolineae bacterium]
MSGLLQVLVIEDNPDDAELMARALRQNGFEFDWQRVDTQAGLLRALKRRPDIVLSDYNLPGWTGIEAFEALRKAGNDTPFILVTGALGDEAAVECLKRGMADYVLKENLQRLPLAVRRALESHQERIEHTRVEQALEALARGTAQVVGEAFFPALVENLARALGVRWALVGRLRGDEREMVETLALWDADHLADNITYDLAGAPCQDVARKGFVIHADGVQTRFPQDVLLQEMGAECYAGSPLLASDGSVVGILAVLDDQPYRVSSGVEEIFRVFAARAAVELERLQQMAALEEAAQEWGRTFDTMSDMVTIHDSEFRIVRANRAAARAFGFEPEDMIGKQCYQVFHHLDCPVENCPLRRSLRSGELETLEIWEPTIDKHLLITTNPIRDAEGRLTGVVHVARDITARKRTEATLQALNAAAADLQRVGLSEAEIYGTATEQLTALGLQGAITLFDAAADSFTFEYFFLPGGLLATVERLTGVTPAGFLFPRARVPAYDQVVQSGQAVYVADRFAQIVAKLLPDSISRLAGQLAKMIGPASAILAPLRVEDRVMGVLHVGADWVTEADAPAITAFADQLSAALENARLYQAALQAAERRNILHWASQEIVRVAEDPEQVYHAVHQAAAQLMPCEAFVIALADETRQEVSAVYLVDQGGRWPAQRIPTGRSLSGQVLASGEPLLIQDFTQASSEIDAVHFGDPEHVRSILAVPMRLGERIVGVISAQSYRPHAYTTEDQHLLEMLAAHAAVAVENTRLYEAERRQTAELARSNRFITALGHVAARIETAPDPDGAMETLGAELKELGLTCFVAQFEPEGSAVVIRYVSIDSAALALTEKLTGLKSRGFRMERERWSYFSEVVEHGRATFVTDLTPAAALLPPASKRVAERVVQLAGVTPDTPAILLPLKVEEQLVGVLGVWGEDLREADLPAATIFASQVAGALERAQLFDETRRRAEETAALLTTAQAITSLDLNAVLETIVRQARTLFRADGSRIHLIEPDGETLRCAVALHDRAEDVMAVRLKLGQGFTGRVALSGEPELILNTLADSQHIQVPGTPVEPEAVALTPLKVGQQTVGVMTVTRLGEERPFTQSDLDMLTAFANQAAVAIEQARLYEAEREQRSRAQALEKAAAALTATLDPDQVLDRILEEVSYVVPNDAANVMLIEGHQVRAVRWRGYERFDAEEWVSTLVLHIPEMPVFQQMMESGEPIVIPDVATYSGWVQMKEWLRSYAAVPIVVRGEVIGFLNVYSATPGFFTQAHAEALRAFAGHAAAALENARLYEAVQQELTERKQAEEELRQRQRQLSVLNRMGRALAGTLELARIYRIAYEHVAQLVDSPNFGISLYDPTTRTLQAEFMLDEGELIDSTQFPPLDMDMEPTQGRVRAIATRQPEIITDYPSVLEKAKDGGGVRIGVSKDDHVIGAAMYVPMVAQDQVIGLLEVQSYQLDAYGVEHAALLGPVANQIGLSIQNARLYEQTQERLRRIAALREVDAAITASLDLRITLDILLNQLTTQLHVDAADVLLLTPHTQRLEYAAGRGFRTAAPRHTHLRLGEGLAGRAALEQQIINIADLSQDKDAFERAPLLDGEGFISYFGVPLIAKGKIKGVLEVFHRAPLHPSEEWVDFLETLSTQAAIAIDNATLLDQLQRSNLELTLAYDVTLEGWSRALELRDAETEGHTRRVTDMTLRLARAMGLNGSTLAHIRRGALLHDIGKLGIPDSVLLKPGELDDEDWDIIRLHPVYSHELLSPISYLRPALDIPYCHHERWDGTGYPRGLKGEQIPLPARIFAVVDVYDALRSDRPYRKAWPEEKVRNHILEQAGKHFDPEVVEVFMRLLENGL